MTKRRAFSTRSLIGNKLSGLSEKIEQSFDLRFQAVARDPRFLALVASSLNYGANVRIESRKLEVELTSFFARVRHRQSNREPSP